MIYGTDIKLDWAKTDADWAVFDAFAASFDHKLEHQHATVLLKKNGMPFAHAQIYQKPIVFTGWHTNKEVCTPRDVIEGMKLLAGWVKMQHGSGCVAVPHNCPTFTPGKMDKFGMKRLGCELYECSA